jgi:hypothetical protein
MYIFFKVPEATRLAKHTVWAQIPNSDNVASTSQVRASTMMLSQTAGNSKVRGRVTSISDIVKIGKFVQMLKDGHTDSHRQTPAPSRPPPDT